MLAVRKNRYVILSKDFDEGAFLAVHAPQSSVCTCTAFISLPPLKLAVLPSSAAYKNVIHKNDDEHSFYK